MCSSARARFVAVSTFYFAVVGYLGGACVSSTLACWRREPIDVVPDIGGPAFMVGITAGIAIAAIIQLARVAASMRRSEMECSEPASGFWSFDAWMHGKVLWTFLLPPMLAWLVRAVV
jgi:hypothetical protein